MGFLRNIIERIKLMGKSTKTSNYYKVEITDNAIKILNPYGNEQQIELHEIEEIKMVNTEDGPLLPDRWLVLTGNGKICSIPQNNKAWYILYDFVSGFPGFNFQNVMKSAEYCGNKSFILWKKEDKNTPIDE